MATTPFPGDGVAAHLAWLADRLGSSGSWLVDTMRHVPDNLNAQRRWEVTHDLVATLEQLTQGLPGEWCPEGSLEVHGSKVGDESTAVEEHDEFVDIDGGTLSVANPDNPFRAGVELHFLRLPASMVAPIQRLSGDSSLVYLDQARDLVRTCVWGWQDARSAEIGLSRNHECGMHLRWARAGHTILTALADHYDAWRDAGIEARGGLQTDVLDPVGALGRQVLDEQALPNPPYGPLRRDPAKP